VPNSAIKKVVLPIAIIVAGALLLAFMTYLAPEAEKKEIFAKPPLVEVLKVSSKKVVFEIESQGNVVPRTETTLVSEVSGQIKTVSNKFVIGGYFKKGELILEIDPINYQVILLQTQARLDGANARLVEQQARADQAQKEWSLTGRSSKKAPILALRKPQLQQAKADVKAAQADVKGAQIKLQRTKILAPYNAMIKKKMVDIGQYVSTGSPLAISFAVDYAEVRLPILERDIAYINIPKFGQVLQQGNAVELSINQAGKKQKWHSFISRSEGVVDSTSRVNYIVAQINDPYGFMAIDNLSKDSSHTALPIGSFVKAKITGKEVADVTAIPLTALRGANEIYLVDENNKLKTQRVDILRSDQKYIYVSSTIPQGYQVVLTKLATAVNGMSLRIKANAKEISQEKQLPKAIPSLTHEEQKQGKQ